MPYPPGSKFHLLSADSNVFRTRKSIGTVTACESPGCSVIRFQPASRRYVDSCVPSGRLAYISAISVPVRFPVFVTVKRTLCDAESTLSREYSQEEYDRPKPKGKSGCLCCASNHL